MSIHLGVDAQAHVGFLVLQGPCDYSGVVGGLDELAHHEDLEANAGVLVDFRDTPYAPDRLEALELADHVAQPEAFLPHRLALVAPRAAQLEAATRIATVTRLRGGVARVFHEAERAVAWLSIGTRGPTG